MYRQDIEPWRTIIREVSLPLSEKDTIVTEILSTNLGQKNERVEDDNLVLPEKHPTLTAFITDVVVPEMIQYVIDVWGYAPNKPKSVSWIRCTMDGSDLQPHHHATPLVSAVLYVEGHAGDLALMDPRGTAERGLPSDVRSDNFGTYKHTPEPGSLVIFPSYLFHHVISHDSNLRIAVPTDLYFT